MLFDSSESERLIESLRRFDIGQVGTDEWMQQHLVLQKLNLQAHDSVQSNKENFVLEQLVTFDKLPSIIHELIVIEAWREKVVQTPSSKQVLRHLANNFSIRGYHALFHEATLCNLLEVVLYHDYAAQSCGDTVVELVDYCCRRIRWIVEESMRSSKQHEDEGQGEEEEKNEKEFERQLFDLEWRCSVAAVSVLRYLCEHVTQLPLAVMTRMIETHDIPCMVIPLIENPPWTRRMESGKWEKFKDQKWRTVPSQDLLMLTSLEAQPWLILFNLLCEGEVRKRYHFHSFRKESILRVRKYLNATLVDQLPVLADLQRIMDELVVMDAPPATTSTRFVLEQVAEIRDRLMGSTNWDDVIQSVLTSTFKGKETKDDALVLQLAGMYGDESVEALLARDQHSDFSDPALPTSSLDVGTAQQVGESPPVPPPQQSIPQRATLLLQNGSEFVLRPVSKYGTAQTTSQGVFLRYQLKPMEHEGENDSFAGNGDGSLNADVALKDIEGAMLKMIVETAKGERREIFSKKLAPFQPAKPETWTKLGSIKQGVLAQVQCTLLKAETNDVIRLGTVFISLKQ